MAWVACHSCPFPGVGKPFLKFLILFHMLIYFSAVYLHMQNCIALTSETERGFQSRQFSGCQQGSSRLSPGPATAWPYQLTVMGEEVVILSFGSKGGKGGKKTIYKIKLNKSISIQPRMLTFLNSPSPKGKESCSICSFFLRVVIKTVSMRENKFWLCIKMVA